MLKLLFMNAQPVVYHQVLSNPNRILRTNKQMINLELIVACEDTKEFTEFVLSLDANDHASYLVELADGKQMSTTKWVNQQIGWREHDTS